MGVFGLVRDQQGQHCCSLLWWVAAAQRRDRLGPCLQTLLQTVSLLLQIVPCGSHTVEHGSCLLAADAHWASEMQQSVVYLVSLVWTPCYTFDCHLCAQRQHHCRSEQHWSNTPRMHCCICLTAGRRACASGPALHVYFWLAWACRHYVLSMVWPCCGWLALWGRKRWPFTAMLCFTRPNRSPVVAQQHPRLTAHMHVSPCCGNVRQLLGFLCVTLIGKVWEKEGLLQCHHLPCSKAKVVAQQLPSAAW